MHYIWKDIYIIYEKMMICYSFKKTISIIIIILIMTTFKSGYFFRKDFSVQNNVFFFIFYFSCFRILSLKLWMEKHVYRIY